MSESSSLVPPPGRDMDAAQMAQQARPKHRISASASPPTKPIGCPKTSGAGGEKGGEGEGAGGGKMRVQAHEER